MPQLNPGPWFSILMFSWMVFVILIIPKTLNHTFPNNPTPQMTHTPKTNTWLWPW
uniref:ATP synthase complex subunit 8 n=1 Tax=Brachygobius doriae TaxID=228544 RepID=A0A343AX44_9GOBI|nr:ATP synthase F0 subunit 8 [Brachygobius doriae]APT69159.1 ATP synthase F0 subunit 8 [Brachygobius doriae]